jgi:hypothetical protein
MQKKCCYSLAAATLTLAAGSLAQRAEAITLARNGTPTATIVVAQAALNPDKDDKNGQKISVAAHDLQDYIRKISGATLPLVGDDQNPTGAVVLVGKSKLTAAQKLDIPSGLTPERREEGFLIDAHGNRLILAGNDEGPYHGTEYATYHFLENLGVRWFMPGDYGEVVPHQTTIDVADMAVRQKPSFIMRNWWAHMLVEQQPLERRWKIRNGMNPDEVFATPGDSSVRNYTADPALVKTKPELFAKNLDGTINPYMPNLTNPEAVKIAADKFKEQFRKDPKVTSMGIAPDDGLPRDFNESTLKINQNFTELGGREGEPAEKGISEEWFTFVDNVLKEVKQEFPNNVITTNGYANRDMPPVGVPVDPNIGLMYAAIWSDMLHAYDDPKSWMMVRQGQNLQRWTELCNKVWLYNYDYTMLVSALTPVPTARKIARDYPLLHKWGVIGFADETRNAWMEAGIPTHYVRTRLEWDANANVPAMLNDFYGKWYGAAARPASAFWDDIEAAIENSRITGHEDRVLPPLYTPELLSKLNGDIQLEEAAAQTESEKQHVHVDRLIFNHLQEYMAMTNAEYAGDFAAASRHGGNMLALRQQLYDINSFWTLPKERGFSANAPYASGVWYWNVQDRINYYNKLAGMTNGTTGDLVMLLPQQAQFALDPRDDGRFARWYNDNADNPKWTTISTTTPFYLQGYMDGSGYPYMGYMWYRFKVDVPASAKGKPIHLYAPVIETEGWTWVNGKYVGHRPYMESYVRPDDMDLDVTDAIKPGQTNTIAIRISTSLNPAASAAGMESRVFLYSPKATAAAK